MDAPDNGYDPAGTPHSRMALLLSEVALWLFKLAYLIHVIRGRQRTVGLADVAQELGSMNLGDPLQTVFDKMLAKR